MRKDVMIYYNDQIMDNLVKAKNHLPFVHVDIQTLSSQGASQITGTVGYGKTITDTGQQQVNTGIAPGIASTLVHTAMWPFSYNIAPQRSETLSITAAPALGSQAVVAPISEEKSESNTDQGSKRSNKATSSSSPPMEITKVTTVEGGTTTEKTPTKPQSITVYKLYQDFADSYVASDPAPPGAEAIVPGTIIKTWNKRYYYIPREAQDPYYEFCERLFTKGQSGPLEKEVRALRGEIEVEKLSTSSFR